MLDIKQQLAGRETGTDRLLGENSTVRLTKPKANWSL